MNISNPFFPRHAFVFKGGGGGGTPAASAPVYQAPAAVSKPPAAVPPVTERTIEVEMASRDSKLAAKKRKGFRSTLLAGETGGYAGPATDQTQTKSLLG